MFPCSKQYRSGLTQVQGFPLSSVKTFNAIPSLLQMRNHVLHEV